MSEEEPRRGGEIVTFTASVPRKRHRELLYLQRENDSSTDEVLAEAIYTLYQFSWLLKQLESGQKPSGLRRIQDLPQVWTTLGGGMDFDTFLRSLPKPPDLGEEIE